MTELRSPLFLGLTRPARYFGLPVAYFGLWSGTSGIGLIVIESLWVIPVAALSYVGLRILAEREPAYFEVLAVAARQTRRTRNRGVHGGDRYDV